MKLIADTIIRCMRGCMSSAATPVAAARARASHGTSYVDNHPEKYMEWGTYGVIRNLLSLEKQNSKIGLVHASPLIVGLRTI